MLNRSLDSVGAVPTPLAPTSAPSEPPAKTEPVQAAASDQLLVSPAPSGPPPKWGGLDLPANLDSARSWRPGRHGLSGVQANAQITKNYETIDHGMTDYLGQPVVPNWASFGKYASATAGSQIKCLEEMMGAEKGRLGSVFGLVKHFVQHPLLSIHQALSLANGISPDDLGHNAQVMRDALAYGNTAIIQDVGPAFDTFLSAESKGQSGLDALKARGYGEAPRDPQGFILPAFEKYTEARQLEEQLESPSVGAAEAKDLMQRRKHVIFEGNLLLGLQEQLMSLQNPHVFGDPAVAAIVGRVTPTMTLQDANGTHHLLNGKGNWADFATRMGLREATPEDDPSQVYTLRDNEGDVHRYALDFSQKGTIADYFRTMTEQNTTAGAKLAMNEPGKVTAEA